MPDQNAPPTATPVSGPTGKVTLASARARAQLEDALALTHYAVSAGIQTAAGDPLPFDDIATIQSVAIKLGEFNSAVNGAPPAEGFYATSAEWVAFQQAYYRLAVAMNPVTAETLRATAATTRSFDEVDNPHEHPIWRKLRKLRDVVFGYSPALRFTRSFWLIAIVFALFVITAESWIYVLGQEKDVTTKIASQKTLLEALVPWAYGGLGSCAYLLRSAHYFIYQRSFDLRRKPEYFNRILLGAISGGAIILFVNYLVGEDGTVVHLSSAALGFVAGYSTDFLFNAIERVVAAIFPKVAVENAPRGTQPRKQAPRKPPKDLPDEPGNGDKPNKRGREGRADARGQAQNEPKKDGE